MIFKFFIYVFNRKLLKNATLKMYFLLRSLCDFVLSGKGKHLLASLTATALRR